MNDPYIIKEPVKRRPSLSPIVNALREAVFEWRKSDYNGASETSKKLLNFWFEEEHKYFQYYFAQRESVETLIYLYEVAQIKEFFELWRKYDVKQLIDPRAAKEICPRYVFKMATGSGKTKVMSLAIVWSYFHKLREAHSTLTKNFVMVAPNIIVFERLREDFADNKVFLNDPLIPPSWMSDFNIKTLLQDEFTTANTDGNIYLTNIHRLFGKEEKEVDNPVIELIGKKPTGDIQTSGKQLLEQVLSHKDLMVINDEAHHVHEEDLAWFQTIAGLQTVLKGKGLGLSAQLDFSATPKTQSGSLFPQVIVDYPLVEAIEDAVVKRPILPDEQSTRDFVETPSNDAAQRYKLWIDLGVSRWRQYKDKLTKTGKKPVLFIMTTDTKDASSVQSYLEGRYREYFVGKILEIHTKVNRSGEISEASNNKEYLQELRRAVKDIDSNDNPYHAIVSVIMLREGWDVRNVTVVVGLRPYTAKANILPEQTIGRGLRRMDAKNLGWVEKVDIIGTQAFEEFVRQLEQEEVSFDRERMTEPPTFKEVFVEAHKVDAYDIEIPLLMPIISRETKNLTKLTVASFEKKIIKRKHYGADEVRDIIFIDAITRDIDEKHRLKLERPKNPESVVTFFTKVVVSQTKATGQFATIYPLVEGYIKTVLFGEMVDLNDKDILKQLSEAEPQKVLYQVFSDAINKATLTEQEARGSGEVIRVSQSNGYEWSKETFEGEKQVFNLVACDSHYEADFADFLDRCDDVASYVKNERATNFYIEYLNHKGNMRYYFPDFVVKTKEGMFIVETKGREDLEVAQKDARTNKWCQDASKISGIKWHYLKVPQDDFYKYQYATFNDLISAIK